MIYDSDMNKRIYFHDNPVYQMTGWYMIGIWTKSAQLIQIEFVTDQENIQQGQTIDSSLIG